MTSGIITQLPRSHGVPLREFPPAQRLNGLPSYARAGLAFPRWKQNFIRSNRDLYARHHKWLDSWIPKIRAFPPSLQKLEWNCKGEPRDIWRHLIQFRASGVRVKRPTSAPSLISCTTTQVPILGWEKRYLTPRECGRLQSLKELKHLPTAATPAYSALGNAVNADLVEKIAEQLLGRSRGWRGTAMRDVAGGGHAQAKA
jgi:DNA (cytosine-5)-methyltransferase 1